jgi:hypothetical protein
MEQQGKGDVMSCLKDSKKKLHVPENRCILPDTPTDERGRFSMGKAIKIFAFTFMCAAFVYAQAPDSTAVQDSSQAVTVPPAPPPSTGGEKATTGTKPGKPPTNWSKIKDLFL